MCETNHYNAHVKLPGTFEELIINLKRDNNELMEQINFEKKKMLCSLNQISNPDKDIIINLINTITESIENHTYKLEECNATVFMSEDLQNFYKVVKDAISKIEANDFLLSQIISLQKEFDELLKQKQFYESQGMNFFDKLKSSFKSK